MPSFNNEKVILLNKSWLPLGFIGIRRAITLLFAIEKDGSSKASIIDQTSFQEFTWDEWSVIIPKEGEKCIRTPNMSFLIPRIVLLHNYNKPPQRYVNFSRRAIYKRDHGTCQYCSDKPKSEYLTIDHVVPRCQGGSTSWENCTTACVDCNCKKAGRTPEQAGLRLLRLPFRPKLNFDTDKQSIKSLLAELESSA